MIDSRSRIDLHVHSTRSGPADGGLQRLLSMADSYTSPEEVYRLAMSRGMDFVTITDHDRIGALENLEGRPGFFISEEVTTQFPEDGVGVHVVVLNVTSAQHDEIQRRRPDVYEFVRYLRAERLVHFIAHPFFPVTVHPTIEHLERMLLLFNVFEVKNGGKQLVPDDLLTHILDRLTPRFMHELANKHDLEPFGPTPWRKSQVGGSDDHAGAFIAHPHTSCPKSCDVAELLAHIECGDCRVEGPGGSTLMVAHSALAVIYRHFKAGSVARGSLARDAVWNLLGQILDNADLDRGLGVPARMFLFLNDTLASRNERTPPRSPAEFLRNQLAHQLRRNLPLRRAMKAGLDFGPEGNEQLVHIMIDIVNDAIVDIVGQLHNGGAISRKAANTWNGLLSLCALLAPYAGAFRAEARHRALMREARTRFLGETVPPQIAVFVDGAVTPRGVSQAHGLLREECDLGAHVDFVTLCAIDTHISASRMRFAPVTTLRIGKNGQEVDIPPVLDIARKIAERDYTHIYVQTTGPMGVLGVILGQLLDLPVIAADTESTNGQQPLLNLATEVRTSTHERRSHLQRHGIVGERIMVVNQAAAGNSDAVPAA